MIFGNLLPPNRPQTGLDLVIWDSHPLALGATPSQVYIDGISQLRSVHVVHKPSAFQESPRVPNFDKEALEAVKYEGLPPLAPNKSENDVTVFTGVRAVYTRGSGAVQATFAAEDGATLGVAVVRHGSLVCSGMQGSCLTATGQAGAKFIDLDGGSISPGLVSFGSPLGLEHINQESSTNDGNVYDPLVKAVPTILGGDTSIVRAVDGLQYGSRDAL